MVYSDQLPDPKAAKVLKGFDIAEPGDWIQQLDRRWRETLGIKQCWRCYVRKRPLLMQQGEAGALCKAVFDSASPREPTALELLANGEPNLSGMPAKPSAFLTTQQQL